MPEHTSMNISVPKPMREFVAQRMKQSGFANVSEYVRTLIREDRKRAANEHLETMLLEGLDSGRGIPATREYWAGKQAKLESGLAGKKGNSRRRAG